MNKKTILLASNDLDEAPIWTDTDFKQAVHRVGLKPLPQKKQKINIAYSRLVQQQAGGEGIKRLLMLPYGKLCRQRLSKKRYGM